MAQHTNENIKWIALTAVIAIAVISVLGSSLLSGLSTDNIEIRDASLKKGTSTNAILTLSVTNLGNSPITITKISVFGLTGATEVLLTSSVPSSTLGVGATVSFSESIPSTDTLSTGASFPVTVTARINNSGVDTAETATTDDITVTDTVIVYVTGI